MGFRFRKSVKIAPGVRLNLNRKSANSYTFTIQNFTSNIISFT